MLSIMLITTAQRKSNAHYKVGVSVTYIFDPVIIKLTDSKRNNTTSYMYNAKCPGPHVPSNC